jgi:hypothetical protein
MDAEPTLAADVAEAETQGCYAWSQADDAEAVTTYIPRRSWKSPLLAVAAVVALLSAGFVVYKINDAADGGRHWNDVVNPPTASATKPQVAPIKPQVAPPALQDDVARYAALYRSRGGKIIPGHEKAAAAEARDQICVSLATDSVAGEINAIVLGSPGFSRYWAAVITNTAIDVYCPQYGDNK